MGERQSLHQGPLFLGTAAGGDLGTPVRSWQKGRVFTMSISWVSSSRVWWKAGIAESPLFVSQIRISQRKCLGSLVHQVDESGKDFKWVLLFPPSDGHGPALSCVHCHHEGNHRAERCRLIFISLLLGSGEFPLLTRQVSVSTNFL